MAIKDKLVNCEKQNMAAGLNSPKKIFLVREYLLVDDYGGIRIDEEAVFFEFNEALQFLNSLEDRNATGSYFVKFRIEIIEFEIGNIESCTQSWIFNVKGKLLEKISQKQELSISQKDFSGKFKVGDIVFIQSRVESPLSPSVEGTYGVIVELPSLSIESFDWAGKNVEMRREYIVYFVNEFGLLDHKHSVESAMILAHSNLPDELKFLKIFSKFLKKEINFSQELLQRLLNEEILVKKIKRFNFEKNEIE